MMRIRDQHCRFPACRISAPRCDCDHTIAWSRGGPTAIENLAALCRYHQVVKHEAGWKAVQLGDGTIQWTTALGYTILTEPPSNEMYKVYPSTPSDRSSTHADSSSVPTGTASAVDDRFASAPPF